METNNVSNSIVEMMITAARLSKLVMETMDRMSKQTNFVGKKSTKCGLS